MALLKKNKKENTLENSRQTEKLGAFEETTQHVQCLINFSGTFLPKK